MGTRNTRSPREAAEDAISLVIGACLAQIDDPDSDVYEQLANDESFRENTNVSATEQAERFGREFAGEDVRVEVRTR